MAPSNVRQSYQDEGQSFVGLKRGYVLEEDTPGVGEARIRRFRLTDGSRVYLPRELAAYLMTQHSPAEEFFFVEAGLLGRTAWAGTLGELRHALETGAVSSGDVGRFELPVQEPRAGWNQMLEEDDHMSVGAKVDRLAEQLRKSGRPETAAVMTVEAWVANATSEGACVAEVADRHHGGLRCTDGKGHGGSHTPVCPECDIVKQVMFAVAQSAGAWGR